MVLQDMTGWGYSVRHLISVDIAAAQYVDVFDIKSTLQPLHVLLMALIHSLNVFNGNSVQILHIAPLNYGAS